MADPTPAAAVAPVCPTCGGTEFIVGQYTWTVQRYASTTDEWSVSNIGDADDYPVHAMCAKCEHDCTELLRRAEDVTTFYAEPTWRPLSDAPPPDVQAALTYLRGCLVDEDGYWITELSGADIIEHATHALELAGLGGSADDTEKPDVEDDDDGCPKDDPDCTSRADECHDACETPEHLRVVHLRDVTRQDMTACDRDATEVLSSTDTACVTCTECRQIILVPTSSLADDVASFLIPADWKEDEHRG